MAESDISKIKLTPFEKENIPLLIQWIQTPKFLLQWAGPGYSYPLTEEQVLAHIFSSSVSSGKTVILKAVLFDSGVTIGHGEILGIDTYQQAAVLGRILIGPDEYRGKGYGLKLVQALTWYAFENFPIHRLGLNVFSYNTAAIECYRKAGFIKEGELRDARYFEGEFISATIMSLLRPQYTQLYKQEDHYCDKKQ
ncbi:MAG: GNAT family N-acetyltransferase [Candidatus Marinimicrobia bacterium]|nr:GNAT family N-acetyltransferase [Candidatus Neomarinimicrobiota bacterium]